jgi:hypothetical protein
MRGLTCFANKAVTTNITNVNVEAFVVAMRPEGTNCTVNLDKVKFYNCWQGQIFIWNDNGFQLDNWCDLGGDVGKMHTLPGRFGAKIYIEDSLLGKCGGPVILSQTYRASEAANNELSVDVIVDDKSELYSYVTGQEAWFVAVNQTAMAAQISALDAVVKGTASAQNINASYLSDQKIQGVKTMNMVMVVMGAGVAPGEQYSGSFSEGYKDGNGQWHVTNVMMQMIKDASLNKPAKDTQPWFYDRYMSFAKSSQAPIFTTSAGGHCYAAMGASPACYTYYTPGEEKEENLNENFSSGNMFQGDYITMYMFGMGIMLEYYN